jgi:hypothetical protein
MLFKNRRALIEKKVLMLLSQDKETMEGALVRLESRYTRGIWVALMVSFILMTLTFVLLGIGDYLFGVFFAVLLVIDLLTLGYFMRSLRRVELARRDLRHKSIRP